MKKTVLAAIICIVVACGAAVAEEAMAPGPQGKPMMGHHQQKHEMMVEEQQIMLQSIQLLKEMAKDKETKAKAEALEKRQQALIIKHQQMYAEMMKMMDEGGMQMGPMMHRQHMMGTPSAPPAKQ
ncbi:MAG: hypothetical protein HZA04_07370 [Nitrospinae bacterium]|nr:hypothetical protein [Nitrospinota bacterium]